MAKKTIVLTGNTTGSGHLLYQSDRRDETPMWNGCIYATGDFGGGTIALMATADGAALVGVPDSGGVVFTATDDFMTPISMAGDLWIQLTGATAPSITLNLFVDEDV